MDHSSSPSSRSSHTVVSRGSSRRRRWDQEPNSTDSTTDTYTVSRSLGRLDCQGIRPLPGLIAADATHLFGEHGRRVVTDIERLRTASRTGWRQVYFGDAHRGSGSGHNGLHWRHGSPDCVEVGKAGHLMRFWPDDPVSATMIGLAIVAAHGFVTLAVVVLSVLGWISSWMSLSRSLSETVSRCSIYYLYECLKLIQTSSFIKVLTSILRVPSILTANVSISSSLSLLMRQLYQPVDGGSIRTTYSPATKSFPRRPGPPQHL